MNEILYVVQYFYKGESHIYWPSDEIQYKKAVAHIRRSGCQDYSVGRTRVTVLDDNSIRMEWETVERKGIYKERP